MSTTVTYKGNTLTTVNNATKTLKTAGKYMEGDVTLVDDSKPTYTDVENNAGGRTITVNDGVITTGSKVAHILPTGMYDLPSDAAITNESNMYTTVDSETYATILSKSFPSVGYFDFSVLPDNAIVKSFELLFKTASGTNINRLNQSQVLYFGQQSVLNNTTALPFRQNPEITSIDLEGVTWNDIISNKSVLNLVIPSSDDSDYRYYGIEFRVTYDLPINKVVYGTTSLVDLTADTITPTDLALGVMAHDASGATIEGTFYLQDYLDITPTEDSQYFDPGSSASRGELIENRKISIEKISGLNINTELNSALGNVAFNTAAVYFVGEIEVTCNYIVQGSTLFSGTTTVYIDGASKMGERGWFSAYNTTSYSGDGDAYRISGILAKGSSSHLTTITCTGQNTNAYYYYDISGWLDTYSSPIASGFRMVNVSAIPSEYIIPTGTKSITENGTGIDVAQYASVDVAVPISSTPTLQTKTATPTEQQQTVSPDSGYDGLSSVTVEAINSTYVGSSITQRTSTDLTRNAYTIIVPAGYYAEDASKAVERTPHATPTISLNSSTGAVTAIHSQVQGWVEGSGSGPDATSATLQLDTQAAKTITPMEEPQTAVVAGKYTIGAVTVGAIPSTYIGTSINQRDSDDLTVSGATVTVPAGYYNEVASKSVETMTYNKSNNSVGTLWDSINATPTMQYLNFSKGYLSENKYIRVWTSSGSATAPASITGTAATISTGTNTLTLTKSVSVTPSVTAGYVSSGTAGNSSVSLTASVSTKAAATITPGTTNQTIAADTYITGTQTIVGDADLVASNIISTANIFGVQGNVVVQNYYTGSSEPSSSLGQNGDIYLQE